MVATRKYTEEIVDEGIPNESTLSETMSTWRVVLLHVSFFATSATSIALSVVVVPAHIEAMVGSAMKGRALGGMVAGSAVLMFLLGPPIGMVSDRLTSSLGKRRPIMIASTVFLCISLAGLAFSAPSMVILKSMGTARNECHVDLEERRCHHYVNGSAIQWNRSGKLQNKVKDHSNNINAGHFCLYILFYLMTMASVLCYTVPYNALIADITRPEVRGYNSGLMGLMILIGNLAGAFFGLLFEDIGIVVLCVCLIGIFIVCAAITVFSVTEIPGKRVYQPLDWKEVIIGFWAALKEHDFRWVFITRFLMEQGIHTGFAIMTRVRNRYQFPCIVSFTLFSFLEYWLHDMVQLPKCLAAHQAVSLILMPLFATAAIGSVVSGILSDKCGRRKLFVVTASLAMFAVTFSMACVKEEAAFILAAVGCIVFGASLGTYKSVDFALVMDVLPEEKDKAKDVAVWYQAQVLPQALATPIGGLVLDVFEEVNCRIGLGYILLLVISSLYFLLGGLFVTRIRTAR